MVTRMCLYSQSFEMPSDSDDYAQLITTPRPTTSTSEIPVTTTTSETAAVTPRSSVQRPSDEACSKYRNLDFPSLDFHILGGFPTILGEFPHMVSTNSKQFICSQCPSAHPQPNPPRQHSAIHHKRSSRRPNSISTVAAPSYPNAGS